MLILLAASLCAATPQSTQRIEFVGDGWTAELRAEIATAIDELPPKVREFPGGPLQLELHDASSAFGIGDGSEQRPEWTEGHRRFHLYAYSEPAEPRAVYRLEKLSPAEREHLWRRRAVVHAVLERWDQSLRWSGRSEWLRITGWLLPLDRLTAFSTQPLNPYPWAYSRARGLASPSEDLATFAEEFFEPAERLRSDAIARDDQVECQELSKSRFLRERVSLLEGQPENELFPRGPCPAFDAWAKIDQFDAAEVLFAAPSAVQPESLFGHVFLRLSYRTGRTGASLAPSFDPVFQIAAMQGAEKGASFALKGLTGGLTTVFTRSTLEQMLQTYAEQEQRSLRRYRLNLTRDENVRLLERAFEVERRGFPSYYFFNENCAAWLLFLLNGAVDEERVTARPGLGLVILPTATLDELAKKKSGLSADLPLLTPVPETFWSHRDEAESAFDELNRESEELARTYPAAGVALSEWLRRTQSSSPQVRAAAFDGLKALVTSVGAELHSTEAQSRVLRLLIERLMVEQYAADLARQRKATVLARSLLPSSGGTPESEDELGARQRLFLRESKEARDAKEFSSSVTEIDRRSTEQHRPLKPEEEEAVHRAEASLKAFDALSSAIGDATGGPLVNADPQSVSEDLYRSARDGEATVLETAGKVSGIGTLGVGLGASTFKGVSHPGLVLSGAFVRERLGDQRAIGFSKTTELRLLDAEVSAGYRNGEPSLEWLDVEYLRFVTARTQIPILRESWAEAFGFGVGVSSRFDPLNRTRLDGYALLTKHIANDPFSRFVGVGFGPAIQLAWQPSPHSAAGVRAELVARVPIGKDAIHLGGHVRPAWDFGRHVVATESGLDADLELVTGFIRLRVGGSGELTQAGAIARAVVSADFE